MRDMRLLFVVYESRCVVLVSGDSFTEAARAGLLERGVTAVLTKRAFVDPGRARPACRGSKKSARPVLPGRRRRCRPAAYPRASPRHLATIWPARTFRGGGLDPAIRLAPRKS